jgi:hypothetical protein
MSMGMYRRGLLSARIRISVLMPAPAPYSSSVRFSPQNSAMLAACSRRIWVSG